MFQINHLYENNFGHFMYIIQHLNNGKKKYAQK